MISHDLGLNASIKEVAWGTLVCFGMQTCGVTRISKDSEFMWLDFLLYCIYISTSSPCSEYIYLDISSTRPQIPCFPQAVLRMHSPCQLRCGTYQTKSGPSYSRLTILLVQVGPELFRVFSVPTPFFLGPYRGRICHRIQWSEHRCTEYGVNVGLYNICTFYLSNSEDIRMTYMCANGNSSVNTPYRSKAWNGVRAPLLGALTFPI